MENIENTKSKPNWFLMKLRKLAISIKRDFFIVPLLFVIACTIEMTCSLYIYSPLAPRISSSKFNSFFIFILTLASIISSVNYIFYKNKIKEKNKKMQIIFLILFFVLTAVQFVVEIFLMIEAFNNIAVENQAYVKEVAENGANIDTIYKYLMLSINAYNRYLTHLIMLGLTAIVVALSPLFQKLLKKVKFKRISYEQEK